MLRWAVALLFIGFGSSLLEAEPVYVDLSKQANRDVEDRDGQAGSGNPGWSDEGINDMRIYPPIEPGVIERNGYRFKLIDPQANRGRAVVMLRGGDGDATLPTAVEIPLGDVKATYLYFLQNAVKQAKGLDANFEVAQYTIHYTDGTTATKKLHDGREIMHWWTQQWWANRGRDAWPIYVGRNPYTVKWKFYAGLWAFQWKNPHPDKPMRMIELTSSGTSVPVIWAITLADEDFFEPQQRRETFYKRPPEPPAGFFEPKLALERAGAFAAAVKAGHLQGVRGLDVISPTIVAVTVDNAFAGIGVGSGHAVITPLQKPATFAISSPDDPAYKQATSPTRVGRLTVESWRGDIAAYPAVTLYEHTFFLKLPTPLKPGASYTVSFQKGLEDTFENKASLVFDDTQVVTQSIKVNQVAYAPTSGRRYAYLGNWAAELGTVNFEDHRDYRVLDDQGDVVSTGRFEVRGEDALSGEVVAEADLSALGQGVYRVHVPGLGVSSSFTVGGEGSRDLFYHTARVFYHQRAGVPLEMPYTSFEREPMHVEVYQSGYMVGNPQYKPKPDEPVRSFHGGYYDAADYDCFTYHLRATSQALAAFERYPQALATDQLNIPESGNGIPDILDEADFALSFYVEHQQEDGAVYKGRGHDQDAMRDYEREHKTRPPFGLFPPDTASNYEFAAVAAHYAQLLKPYRPERAALLLDAAKRAFAWSEQRSDRNGGDDPRDRKTAANAQYRLWAAGELFRATGDPAYSDVVVALHQAGHTTRMPWWAGQLAPIMLWPYAVAEYDTANSQVHAAMRQQLIRMADHVLKQTDAPAYRMGLGAKDSGLGWGNANGGGRWGDVLLRAYWLTGDPRYFDAASLNADFQLGANPLSKSLITGLGERVPQQPQISTTLYTGPNKTGETVKGIAIYGLAERGSNSWHPDNVPVWRRYRDISGGAEVSSEFTITETVGAAAMLYSTLYAEGKK